MFNAPFSQGEMVEKNRTKQNKTQMFFMCMRCHFVSAGIWVGREEQLVW